MPNKAYLDLLARDILAGNVQILSDIDGTGSPFQADPKDSYLDKNYAEALNRLNKMHPKETPAIWVTGRDQADAEALVSHPQPDGTKIETPDCPKVVSHGAAYVDKDGVTHNMPETKEEKKFVLNMKKEAKRFMDDMEKKTPGQFAQTVFEIKKNSVVVNVNKLPEEQGNQVLAATKKMFEKLTNGADVENPSFTDDKDGVTKPTFSIKDEEGSIELRNDNAGKDKAVVRFGLIPEGKRVIWMGDSMGETGTDRGLAETVNAMTQAGKIKGEVYHVLSSGEDTRITDPDDPAKPSQTFKDPSELGSFLLDAVKLAEKYRSQNLGLQKNGFDR